MRLREVFTGKLKGLLALDNLPLVERSIQQLRRHGIRKIIIVTGYLAADDVVSLLLLALPAFYLSLGATLR